MIRLALPALAMFLAAPAQSAPVSCQFEQECHATLACTPTDYQLTADLDAGKISDVTGDFDIRLTAEGPDWRQAVFESWGGSFNTLTMGRSRWILSVHIGTGPAVINYYGDCGVD